MLTPLDRPMLGCRKWRQEKQLPVVCHNHQGRTRSLVLNQTPGRYCVPLENLELSDQMGVRLLSRTSSHGHLSCSDSDLRSTFRPGHDRFSWWKKVTSRGGTTGRWTSPPLQTKSRLNRPPPLLTPPPLLIVRIEHRSRSALRAPYAALIRGPCDASKEA